MVKNNIVIIATLFLINISINSQVSISDNSEQEAHQSAVLELVSDDKGFLLPRMDEAEKNAIDDPAESLMIFNTETQCIEVWVGQWNDLWCYDEISDPCDGIEEVTFTYNGNPVTYNTIVGEAGRCQLDRNLGASQVAIAHNDEEAYGDSFQWGRADDGHQNRESDTEVGPVNSDTPGHDNFITDGDIEPNDWRVPQNDGLWQGVNGTNNPCPEGWRIPTEQEWNNEISSWSDLDKTGAFDALKLTVAGSRGGTSGSILADGFAGRYWSSTVEEKDSRFLYFDVDMAGVIDSMRSNGLSVRCIKN